MKPLIESITTLEVTYQSETDVKYRKDIFVGGTSLDEVYRTSQNLLGMLKVDTGDDSIKIVEYRTLHGEVCVDKRSL